jgi:thiazole synthase ThiGH ThiG subunit
MQVESGMIAGLRPQSRVITSAGTYTLTKYDHTVVFNVSSGTVIVYLPASPQEGQEFDLYTCHATMDIRIHPNGKGMYNFIDAINIAANSYDSFTTDYRRHIHIFYAGGQWWENYRYLQK